MGGPSDFFTGEGAWGKAGDILSLGGNEMLRGKYDVDVPQMSEEEKEYLQNINELITEQREMHNAMMPAYAHAMHYKIDASGNWNPMSDEEWLADERTTDAQRQQWEIYTAEMERHKQALKGEVPLTEQMIQQKQKEFDMLRNATGITGETPESATAEDTLGIQRLAEFNKKWGLAEEAQRYGELGRGGQAMLQQTGMQAQAQQGQVGGLMGISTASNPLIQNYGSLLQPYQAYNQMAAQAQAQNQATQAGMTGSGLQLGGMLGAAAIASSKDFKENIKVKSKKEEDAALEKIRKTKSYEYNYKKEMGFGTDKKLGGIAEESPKEIVIAQGKAIDIGNKLELVGMGLKSLSRKVDSLERKVS